MEGSTDSVRVQMILVSGATAVPDEVQDAVQRHGAHLEPVRDGAGEDEMRYRGLTVPAVCAESLVVDLVALSAVDGAYVKPQDAPA